MKVNVKQPNKKIRQGSLIVRGNEEVNALVVLDANLNAYRIVDLEANLIYSSTFNNLDEVKEYFNASEIIVYDKEELHVIRRD